jgi:hypothetical protein
MKKAIFILVLIISLYPLTIKAQWNFVGPAGISEDWTTYNNIDIDVTTGFPVIVYNENNKAVCLKYDGIKWDSVVLLYHIEKGGGLFCYMSNN